MRSAEYLARGGTWSVFAALLFGFAPRATALAAGKPPQPARISSGIGTKVSTAPSGRGQAGPSQNRPIRLASDSEPEPSEDASENEAAQPDSRSVPIDLSSALRLAGVENLDLVVARQLVEEAVAVQQLAAAQILPTLNLGTNYDSHTGVLQQSSGNILNVERSALYAGAGANAVAAGTVSIPGLQYNLNLSESLYGYLVTRKRSEQSRFANRAVENEVLLKVALAYTELLRANAVLSLAILTRNDAREVARLTANYA
ncbi:MAG TPA: TolC family protein, partial [Planctomycetaceae bacterium]|nr:TolC family protein [Planctomycetaceae bacterium]